MEVKVDGRVVGTIALTGLPGWRCPYEGKHGYLPYGFFRPGARKPDVVVCDKHAHNDDGYWGGLLAKVTV